MVWDMCNSHWLGTVGAISGCSQKEGTRKFERPCPLGITLRYFPLEQLQDDTLKPTFGQVKSYVSLHLVGPLERTRASLCVCSSQLCNKIPGSCASSKRLNMQCSGAVYLSDLSLQNLKRDSEWPGH